jgi:hypothetical protein
VLLCRGKKKWWKKKFDMKKISNSFDDEEKKEEKKIQVRQNVREFSPRSRAGFFNRRKQGGGD